MRKQVYGRHLKRDTNERKALFKGLASSLVMYERIQTTEEKAKAVKPLVEKLVTAARRGDMQAHSLVQPYLNAQALKKMLGEIGPRFKDRPGGYTRIIKIGPRLQDNATVVILEWVEKAPKITAVVPIKTAKGKEQSVRQAQDKRAKGKTEKVEATTAVESKKEAKTVKKAATKKKTVKKGATSK
jgi:large subunit ribosomal protein L17